MADWVAGTMSRSEHRLRPPERPLSGFAWNGVCHYERLTKPKTFTGISAHAHCTNGAVLTELSMNLRRQSAAVHLTVFSVLLAGASAGCVSQISAPNTNQDVIQSRSTVVLVPALVRTKSGDIVYTLHADRTRPQGKRPHRSRWDHCCQ